MKTNASGRCGPNFENAYCRQGGYCSAWGWCGTSSQHKAHSANSQYDGEQYTALCEKLEAEKCKVKTSKEVGGRCGPDFENAYCLEGVYCSRWAWCGVSSQHKAHSSNSAYDGEHYKAACETLQSQNNVCNVKVATNGRCGQDFENAYCRPGGYCSAWGWCGLSSQHKAHSSNSQYDGENLPSGCRI